MRNESAEGAEGESQRVQGVIIQTIDQIKTTIVAIRAKTRAKTKAKVRRAKVTEVKKVAIDIRITMMIKTTTIERNGDAIETIEMIVAVEEGVIVIEMIGIEIVIDMIVTEIVIEIVIEETLMIGGIVIDAETVIMMIEKKILLVREMIEILKRMLMINKRSITFEPLDRRLNKSKSDHEK